MLKLSQSNLPSNVIMSMKYTYVYEIKLLTPNKMSQFIAEFLQNHEKNIISIYRYNSMGDVQHQH